MALVCSKCGQKYSERTLSGEPRLYCTICRIPLPGAEQAAARPAAAPQPAVQPTKIESRPVALCPAPAPSAVMMPGSTPAGTPAAGRQLGAMERWTLLIAGCFFLAMAPLLALGGISMALDAAETQDWPSATATRPRNWWIRRTSAVTRGTSKATCLK
jgi:hypothetical protein